MGHGFHSYVTVVYLRVIGFWWILTIRHEDFPHKYLGVNHKTWNPSDMWNPAVPSLPGLRRRALEPCKHRQKVRSFLRCALGFQQRKLEDSNHPKGNLTLRYDMGQSLKLIGNQNEGSCFIRVLHIKPSCVGTPSNLCLQFKACDPYVGSTDFGRSCH